jgi:hypothetical protein
MCYSEFTGIFTDIFIFENPENKQKLNSNEIGGTIISKILDQDIKLGSSPINNKFIHEKLDKEF